MFHEGIQFTVNDSKSCSHRLSDVKSAGREVVNGSDHRVDTSTRDCL